MVDSIHTFHWLERISTSNFEIHILPSRKFRKIHPNIVKLIKENRNLMLITTLNQPSLSPYYDYLSELILKIFGFNRSKKLQNALNNQNYDFIHALEIQHAGYILLESIDKVGKDTKLILTNWGSDIFYYSQFLDHRQKIVRLLSIVHKYSAECKRDYELAIDLGFKGELLELIPNSYSYKVPINKLSKASERKQITAKTYGGIFGLGEIIIECANQILSIDKSISFYLFSVTEDLEPRVRSLVKTYPNRVFYSTVRDSIDNSQLLDEFSKSRIYIGASKSDGISTSFLEAMSQGAYPIQTNTSCASEWIIKGCKATVVGTSQNEILEATIRAMHDDLLVDSAQISNKKILPELTEFNMLKNKAVSFYN